MDEKTTKKACANCGIGIGYYSAAGLTIKYTDLEFCSEACVEEWLVPFKIKMTKSIMMNNFNLTAF